MSTSQIKTVMMSRAAVLPWRLGVSLTVLFAMAVGAAGRADDAGQTEKEKKMTKTESGLQYRDIKEGTGDKPKKGQTCVMHYTGWLWENGEKGKKFDSSVDRGEPFDFPIGTGRVIKGWDEGVMSMKVGGKRKLLIPPDLGYGSAAQAALFRPTPLCSSRSSCSRFKIENHRWTDATKAATLRGGSLLPHVVAQLRLENEAQKWIMELFPMWKTC